MINEVNELQEKYGRLMHGVQSGVAAKMNFDPAETTPKHLRVGINSGLVQLTALALLLMQKGVITELEYWQAVVQVAEQERTRYEEWLSDATGSKVTLG